MSRSRTRKQKSSNWRQRQNRDSFVRQAHSKGLRSRAYFKLEEIDAKFRLLTPGAVVVDLGASPGGWSRYAASLIGPGGNVFAVDVLAMKPIEQVQFIHCDITMPDGFGQLCDAVGAQSANVVLSDMAPNLSGIASTDLAGFERLQDAIFDVCDHALAPGGSLAFKIFNDQQSAALKRRCLAEFKRCSSFKPKSSRSASSETYLIATGYRGVLDAATVD